MVINIEFARGWKAIARMIGGSVSTAQRLYKHRGLPVIYEASTPTLDTHSYLNWRESLPRTSPGPKYAPLDRKSR